MKSIDYKELHVPAYFIAYLVDGDFSGLADVDIVACDEWFNKNMSEARGAFPGAHIEFRYDDLDNANEFNHFPAFGFGCTTVKCVIAVWI